MPFFSLQKIVTRIREDTLPKCGSCGLLKTCNSPKMPVYGDGQKKIMICGEAPGETEDIEGIPFAGKAGRYLRDALKPLGVSLKRDCWIVNSLRCRPVGNIIKSDKMIDYCRPLTIKDIRELEPNVIILLGARAVESVITWLRGEEHGLPMGTWAGMCIPSPHVNAYVCPTWHPSYLMRNNVRSGELQYTLFQSHLKWAVERSGAKPYQTPPKPPKVACTLSTASAAALIRGYVGQRPVAFDYETDRLKPDSEYASIVSCALSDGKRTIAYPWAGEAIIATSEFLLSDTPKLGYNCKFEERWTRRILKHGVNNWLWDGMLAAHVIDNRPMITGLKMQAFLQLGQPDYSSHIKEYLSAPNGNAQNKIRKLPWNQILEYNGMDAYLEYMVCTKQMEQMGRTL